MSNIKSGKIIKTIRFYFNFTQSEFASILGVTQGTLSKIEAGALELSADQWIGLCIKFNIEPNCILTGTINTLPTKLNLDETNFKLPKPFKKNFTATVRFIAPIILFIKKTYGEKYYQHFLITNRLQEEYFCVLSNPINYSLFELFVSELTRKGILNTFTLNQVLSEIDWKEVTAQEKYKVAELSTANEKLKFIVNLFMNNVSNKNQITIEKIRSKTKEIAVTFEQEYLISILQSFILSFKDQIQFSNIRFEICSDQNAWGIICG